MVLVLREEDVRQVLTMPDAVRILDLTFHQLGAGEARNLPRERVVLPENRGVLHVLAAGAPGQGALGYKAYTTFRQGVRFAVMLFSAQDGSLQALIEADWLGRMRTGAASGVATSYLARPEANLVGMIGTGSQARTQLMAMAAVRPLKAALVYGRDAERCRTFCEDLTALLGCEVRPAASAEAAVREAEIVVTVTTAAQPVLNGAWLRPGTHVNAVGSNWASRRELDDEAVRRASLVAVDDPEQAKLEAGDLLIPAAAGHFDLARMVPLADIVAGKAPGRSTPEEITLFKSLGIGLEDVAVARHVYAVARQREIGQELAFLS
ncbi:MAG TPA: ornithine cyclodeaminase family protein [Ktedonobacterales bacterium]|jgi:ornithine cyclodeaminase/alanine dehydrogenase-like protein (mu-crystallin family)